MGSSFVDLDATSTAMKTKLDSDAWFERYRIFRIQIKKEKREKGHRCTQFSPRVEHGKAACRQAVAGWVPRACVRRKAVRAAIRARAC